jgi:hypothetical protein
MGGVDLKRATMLVMKYRRIVFGQSTLVKQNAYINIELDGQIKHIAETPSAYVLQQQTPQPRMSLELI